MKKIVYIVGGMYMPNGMSSILTAKINWLAENTDYEMYMILTERPDLPWVYDMSDKVKWVNFDINFDELDTMSLARKIFAYRKKQKVYKRKLSQYLMQIKPTITVSALRREINFINDIKDGSRKIGELHLNLNNYRYFNKPYLPNCINKIITHIWRNSLFKNIARLNKFVVLTKGDFESCPKNIMNIIVIPNFVNKNTKEQSDFHSKKVISMGRYDYVKGFDMLISAWSIVNKKHPEWHLDIYGGGDKRFYENMVCQLDLDNSVKCNSAINNVYEKYVDSSIYVMSSRYEGFGLALVEAMSSGVACIAFNCPSGPYDILDNGKYGLLVENGNIQKLADAICLMIENEQLRMQMGNMAIKRARYYNKDKVMHQWLDLFESLM